jgi:transposase-like protein
MASPKYTFQQFQSEYPDDDACLDKVMEMRYGGTEIECPHCHRPSKFHKISKRRAYACQHCGEHVYPCVGTIFEKSRTPLNKWFFAMYLMTSTRHGVAARELERQLGVTYKCAWRMAHQLRELMEKADDPRPLARHVEVDDAYIGGKPRTPAKHKTGRGTDKAVVIGLVERGGRVKARALPYLRTGIAENIIQTNVAAGARIDTDELNVYGVLADKGFDHQTIKHGAGEYVRGDVHTNSIEGYWSRLKNSIRGTHVHVSKKYLGKYVAEFSYRYNMRKTPAIMFDRMVSSLGQQRATVD